MPSPWWRIVWEKASLPKNHLENKSLLKIKLFASFNIFEIAEKEREKGAHFQMGPFHCEFRFFLVFMTVRYIFNPSRVTLPFMELIAIF